MNKINLGLSGILIIMVMISLVFLNFEQKYDSLNEEILILKSLIEDIDQDLHNMYD